MHRPRSRRGATAIEYALIAGLVSVAIIIGITALSGSLDGLYTAVSEAVTSAF